MAAGLPYESRNTSVLGYSSGARPNQGEQAMNSQESKTEFLENSSRRTFLGAGSAAIAAAALVGLTANAQEKASTQKAEHDHSSSNPGQENRGLLALNPNSNNPPPTDHGDLVPLWYSFDLVKKRVEEGGWTHEVTQRVLPSSRDIAGVNMRLTAGSYREMHWHTADEWAYVLTGNARVTVMNPDGKDVHRGRERRRSLDLSRGPP